VVVTTTVLTRPVQGLAVFGEQQRSVQAAEKRHGEVLLDRGDLPADGGLRERQLFGRLGEAQVPGGGLEGFELVQRRQVVKAVSHRKARSGGSSSHSKNACIAFRNTV
jgi:hypothetical protein